MDRDTATRTVQLRVKEARNQGSDAEALHDTIRPSMYAEDEHTGLDVLRSLGTASLDGKFDIEQTLGQGGMGVVHLAMQRSVGRHVAIKTLHPEQKAPLSVQRVLQEAWLTGALEHPNVVPIYDVGLDASGAPVIVMKRIEGVHWGALMHNPEELRTRFQTNDPLEWNLRVLMRVCNALELAHAKGILHRDLKPENVMIGSFGEVYVLDWGIAVSLESSSAGRFPLASDATGLAGTPSYMAPEMVLAEPSMLCPATDVYLLGALFYEILTRTPPHRGDGLSAMLMNILTEPIEYPAAFPSDARSLCERALHKDPKQRFASVKEFRLAVEAFVQHRGSRKLASDARASLLRLRHTIDNEPAGDERSLAIFHLLGECRFGYRAALEAWPENAAARRGLDRALLAVVQYELAEGSPTAAALLLREVSQVPSEVAARVEEAARKHAEKTKHLEGLERDYDLTVSSRARGTTMGVVGVLWSCVPLTEWFASSRGMPPTHRSVMLATVGAMLAALAVYARMRTSLDATVLNRKMVQTVSVMFALQLLLVGVFWGVGLSVEQTQLGCLFCWLFTMSVLGVWVDARFGIAAGTAAASMVLAALWPEALRPLLAIDILVVTVVVVFLWVPQQDRERLTEKRAELRRDSHQWMFDRPSMLSVEEE